MKDLQVSAHNGFYKLTGLLFLSLAKAKHLLLGYTPRPFPARECDKGIEYDIQVVDHWLAVLKTYAQEDISLEGREVLELGPGADLGVGLYLLSKGVARYNAIDINDLVQSVPEEFYGRFFARLQRLNDNIDIDSLRHQLRLLQGNRSDRLNYIWRPDFDIASAFEEESIDLVFSQAAFEHFDDVEETIEQLSVVSKPGARLVAEIDLRTHSRWIRDKDPNNIYRYGNGLYGFFHFRGTPNRVRPYEYKCLLEKHGWHDVLILPQTLLDNHNHDQTTPFLDRQFQDEKNQMHYLTITLCAIKEPRHSSSRPTNAGADRFQRGTQTSSASVGAPGARVVCADATDSSAPAC